MAKVEPSPVDLRREPISWSIAAEEVEEVEEHFVYWKQRTL